MDSIKLYFTKTGCEMTSCRLDNNLIFPQKFSDSKYIYDYLPNQPIIIHIELQIVVPQPDDEEKTVGGTLADDNMYALEQAYRIIDYNLVYSYELYYDAYSLYHRLNNKNTKNTYLWLKCRVGGAKALNGG